MMIQAPVSDMLEMTPKIGWGSRTLEEVNRIEIVSKGKNRGACVCVGSEFALLLTLVDTRWLLTDDARGGWPGRGKRV